MNQSEGSGVTAKSFVEILVALPIFHLLATSLFIIGYYSSFGKRLSSFAGSSDIFATSVGDVWFNYISSAGLPIVILMGIRAKSGAWSTYDAAQLKSEGEERDNANLRVLSDRKFFGGLICLIALGQVSLLVTQYFKWGFVSYSSIGFFAFLLYSIAIVWYSNKVNIPTLTMHSVNIVGLMLLNSFFNGMGNGQLDRRLSYTDAAKMASVCSSGAILRPVGERLLLVNSKDQHLVSDKDCKPLAYLGVVTK